MIGHYLSGSLRHFRRDPVTSAIKVLALALGLACFLTAHTIGDYFRQADRQWSRAERTVVISQELRLPGAEMQAVGVASSPSLAGLLREDFPDLETVARLNSFPLTVTVGGRERSWTAYAVDAGFPEIFDIEMVRGDRSLERPFAALIEQRAANAAFGDTDPLGQTLGLSNGMDVTVTGVFRPIAPSSHFSELQSNGPAILVQMGAVERGQPPSSPLEDMLATNAITYAVLPSSGSLSLDEFNERLVDFAERRYAHDFLQVRFQAAPVTGITETRFNRRAGNLFGMPILTALYFLGALTLGVGCLNFANLSAVMAIARAREIGTRRAIGASRRKIALQMLIESGLLTLAAFLIVLPILRFLTQFVARQFGLDLTLPGISRIDYWAGNLAIASGVAVAAGVYPAFVLSGFAPAVALRGSGQRGGTQFVRTVFVGAQFAVVTFLLVMVGVMYAQRATLLNKVANPEQDATISIMRGDVLGSETAENIEQSERIREQLLANPAITGVTFGNPPFGLISLSSDGIDGTRVEVARSADASSKPVQVYSDGIYYDYFATSGARVVAGRVFARGRDERSSVVINATAAGMLGLRPADAVGQSLYILSPMNPMASAMTIIGVVDADPWRLTTSGPKSFIYQFQPWSSTAIVRLSRNAVEGGLLHLGDTWARLFPELSVSPIFLDEAFERRYRGFAMINFAFVSLSIVAVLIALMGLYAMATFAVQRRIREIGIRKTFGATVSRLMHLLLWGFARPIVAANLLAWPLAYLAAQAYLARFVNRIELTPAPFLLALAATLVVASLTVLAHVWRAAHAPPAEVLQYE